MTGQVTGHYWLRAAEVKEPCILWICRWLLGQQQWGIGQLGYHSNAIRLASWLWRARSCPSRPDENSCAADTRHWFTLRRRDAADAVSGRLQLEFAWDVTARSLLSLKLAALENVLCQRTEILCALNPVPAAKAFGWIQKAAGSPKSPQQACFLSTPLSLLGARDQQWCPE